MERFRPLHTFLVNKWYFDEAIDFLFVRPAAWLGRFARTTFERVVVDGVVGGATALVGLCSAAVRRIQTGYLRYYAALLLLGITGLGAYFLASA
jgi:NADH-quinone oxidoreductase subunit L